MPTILARLTLRALIAAGLLGGAGVRAQPDGDAAGLADALAAIRVTTAEASAFSATDGRRVTLARRLLALDASHALGHEELALRAVLEFEWRQQMARRFGPWDPLAARGLSGTANRSRRRAERHIDAALATEADRAGAHRLALRLALLAGDSLAFARAAAAWLSVRPGAPDALLHAAGAAFRAGDLANAEALVDRARPALAPADARDLDDPYTSFVADEARAGVDSVSAAERAWRVRDPLLLTPENERHLEHAARLAEADLLFGDPNRGIRGWRTRRGEVYLRYGPPDYDRAWTEANHVDKVFGAYHRWVYGGEDGFVITFEDGFRSGDFDFASSAFGEDDATRVAGLFRTQPERFTLRPPGGVIPLRVQTSAFRGSDGRADLVVAVGVPLDDSAGRATRLGIETGAFLVRTDGTVAAGARLDADREGPAVHAEAVLTEAFTLSARPDHYTLAAEARQPITRRAGAVRQAVDVRRFGAAGLQLSDLLLAELIQDDGGGDAPGVVRRGGFAIRPSVAAAFAVDRPIYVYVEAYGLAVRGGRARYEVEAALVPRDRAGALRRLARLGRGRGGPVGVAVRAEAEVVASGGAAVDDAQYVILDPTGQPLGAYTLTLRVRDAATGQTAEASRSVDLE